MKVYFYMSPRLKKYPFHEAYFDVLSQGDHAASLAEADVVHLFGTWDHHLETIAREARSMGIPYVLTPMGGISPWNMKKPTTRRPLQRLCYLRSLVRHAGAVITTTPMEKAYVMKTKWNPRTVCIANSIFTHHISHEEMIAENTEAQHDVLEKYEADKAASIAKEVVKVLSDELTAERIFLEEKSEEAPTAPQATADHYTAEQAILRQIVQIHSRMPHRNIPHSYLDELHRLLNETDYDEDLLDATLKRMKLLSFARQLFEVMAQATGLTEGFMPVEAKKGHTEKLIREYVTP